MRTTIACLGALAVALVSAPAFADTTPEFTVTGAASIVSDYKFRGISQTNSEPAIQGTLGISHKSGVYVGVWGSSVNSGLYSGSSQEIDIYGGYKKTIGKFGFDVGALYYYYPGSFSGSKTDFIEPYASVNYTYGTTNVKVGGALAPKQGFQTRANLYGYTELAQPIAKTPITLKAHLGYTQSGFGNTFNYLDYSVGSDVAWKQLTFNVSYVGTDAKRFGPLAGLNGFTNVRGKVVVSLTAGF